MADPDDPDDDAASRTFADLLDAHGAAVAAMLRRLCRGGPDADDAFQETAARVWRHLAARPSWRDPGAWLSPRPWVRNPRAWVMAIAYRAFVDGRARRRTHESLAGHDPPDGPTGASVAGHGEGPDRLAERAEAHDRLRSAVAGLSDPVREIVVLHYSGGLTIAQVAAAAGLPGGTVKSRLNAGLAHLRAALAATDAPDGGRAPEVAKEQTVRRETATRAAVGRPTGVAKGGPA